MQAAVTSAQPEHGFRAEQEAGAASDALTTGGWDTADAEKLLSLLEQEHRTALVRRLLCEATTMHGGLLGQEPVPGLVAAC